MALQVVPASCQAMSGLLCYLRKQSKNCDKYSVKNTDVI